MSKAKLRAATVGGSADDIEAAFYQALQQGDLEKLMACWAVEDDTLAYDALIGGTVAVAYGSLSSDIIRGAVNYRFFQ